MAVQLTRKFWFNIILFIVACVALGLAIWAFATPCKKSESFSEDSRECTVEVIQQTKLNEGNENNYLDMATNIVNQLLGSKPSISCRAGESASCAADILNNYKIYCCTDDCPKINMFPQPNTCNGPPPSDKRTIKFYANSMPGKFFYVWRYLKN